MVKERKERGGKGANVMVIHSGGGVGKKSGGGGRKGIPSGVKHKMKKKKEREMLEKKGVVVKGSEDVKASKKRKRDEKDPSLSFGVAPGLDKSAIAKKGAINAAKSKEGSLAKKTDTRDKTFDQEPSLLQQEEKKKSTMKKTEKKPYERKEEKKDLTPQVPFHTLTKKEQDQHHKRRRMDQDPRLKVIDDAKRLWEKAREKGIPPKERRPMIEKLHGLMKTRYCEIILKHDASRIVQTVVKFGTSQERNEVIQEIRPKLLLIAKSNYGCFLVKKVLKYAHTDVREEIFQRNLRTHFQSLAVHMNAYRVVDIMYELGNARQRTFIMDEFYDPSFSNLKGTVATKFPELLAAADEDKKKKILKHTKEFITRFINKVTQGNEGSALDPKRVAMLAMECFHRVSVEYFEAVDYAEKSDMITLFKEHLIHILHTPSGHKLATLCVVYGSAKDRKNICSTLKGIVMNAACDDLGHRVILALLCFTDDTQLLKKALIDEFNANIEDSLYNPTAHMCYLAMLKGRKAPLPPSTLALLAPVTVEIGGKERQTSLKSDEHRCEQLKEHCVSVLFNTIKNQIIEVLNDRWASSVFTTVMEFLGDEQRQEIYSELLAVVPHRMKDEESVLEGRVSSRAIRRIISTSDKLDAPENAFSAKLLEKVKPNLKAFSTKRGSSFVVVSLLESPVTKEETKKLLSGSMAVFKRTDEAGGKVILKLLTEK